MTSSMVPKFRTQYTDTYVDPGMSQDSSSTSMGNTVLGEPEVSLTRQSEAESADVNSIVAKFEKTGVLPVMKAEPRYGDFTNMPTYQEALNTVIVADNAFNSLDAKIRKEFDNDPAKFLAFLDDPANADRAIELGIREPAPPPPPPPAKQSKASDDAAE